MGPAGPVPSPSGERLSNFHRVVVPIVETKDALTPGLPGEAVDQANAICQPCEALVDVLILEIEQNVSAQDMCPGGRYLIGA